MIGESHTRLVKCFCSVLAATAEHGAILDIDGDGVGFRLASAVEGVAVTFFVDDHENAAEVVIPMTQFIDWLRACGATVSVADGGRLA